MNVEGNKIKLGADLTAQEMKTLQKASPTGDQILENIDSLNEEMPVAEMPKEKEMKAEGKATIKSRPGQRNFKVNRSKTEVPVEQNDLDAELARMEKEIEAQRQEAASNAPQAQEEAIQEGPEAAMKNQILEALKAIPGAPGEQQIEMWKRSRGKNSVYVMAFSESDVYIYSFLTRGQHQKIQEIVKKAAEVGNANIENMLKEKVVQNCVLWPKPLPVEFFYNSRAGIVDGLYEAIMIQSGFLSPQQLMLLTTQL